MAGKKAISDLPYNAQAEQAVLGAAMFSRECVYSMLTLEEIDFYLGKHQLIYRAIVNLFNKNSPVDPLTVAEELINMKELDNIGGVNYLKECSDSIVAISSLDFYVGIVSNQSTLRKLILATREIDRRYLNDEIEEIDDFIVSSEQLIKEAIEKRRIADFRSTEIIAGEVAAQINTPREVGSEEDGYVIGLNTGFAKLNTITQGFQKSDMIIVAARPSVGKTALALNFAYQVATRSRKPVAIFSLEMPSELLVKRLIGISSNVSLTKIAAGNFSPIEKNKVAAAIREISEAPIYIDDSSNLKLMDIVTKSRKLQASHNDLGMIIIDYLGLISTNTNSRNPDSRQEEVRKISLQLKALAKELKVPIIVVSQLSRDVEKRGENKRPMLSDLRDSGSIEQDADVVMLLYREDYYRGSKGQSNIGNKKMKDLSPAERFEMVKEQQSKNEGNELPGDASYVEVNVAKNRNGQTGTANLFFFKSFGLFQNPPKEWEEKMRALAEENQ